MTHILLIEDNPGDARLIGELLKEAENIVDGHQITHVERISDAVEILSGEHQIDIILSDITLPDSQGMQTFNSLQQTSSELPVLFMTGSNDEELAMTAINKGAQDYLIKGRISGDSLARAIQYAVERKKFQNEMQRVLSRANAQKQRIKLLADQKRQLVLLNHAKDEFISLASHQLRTPATAVKQYIGMILDGFAGELSDQHRAFLSTAYDSNERQLNIINELLKTAQLDSNTFRLKLVEQDLVPLVTGILEEQMAMLDIRKQTAVFTHPETCIAEIDPVELRIVVSNIIENASKYTPQGKQISVKLTRGKDKIRLAVHDEGVGIDKADQKRIFEKFTRIDNDLSDTVNGTGLGLYWARRIMRLHKGSIAVDSELGKGSTFTLTLPT